MSALDPCATEAGWGIFYVVTGWKVLACSALFVACGGESHRTDRAAGGEAGRMPTVRGGTGGGGAASGGSGGASGATGAGGVSGTPGGFSRDAERVGEAWSSGVETRCRECSEFPDGCVSEDGALVPSPFLLICLSQVAASDPEVAAFLARWAVQSESEMAVWARACDQIPVLQPPPALPPSAAHCASRDFGCPEGETGTACDGVRDCLVGEDESFCGPIADAFTCHRGETFGWQYVCDGVPHCEFGEDERTCPGIAAR